MKKVTGSSGTAVAGLSGLASVWATVRGGGGALRATGLGVGVAALTNLAQTFASEYMEKIHKGLGEVTAKAAEAAALFFAARSIILRRDMLASLTGIYTGLSKKILGISLAAQAARLGTVEATAAARASQTFIQRMSGAALVVPDTIFGKVVAAVDKMKAGILSNPTVRALTLTPWGRAISLAVAAVGASLLFFRKDVNEQLNAIHNQIASAEDALKKATIVQTDLAAEKTQNEELKAGLEAVQKSAKEYFDRTIEGAKDKVLNISGMLSKLQDVSLDLQGSQLAGAIADLQKEFNVTFNSTYNLDQLIAEMNNANAIMAKAEGGRQSYYQKLSEAFEAYNPADKSKINENALVDAFQRLNAAEKGIILNEVNTLDEAIKFQQASETFGDRLKKEVLDKIEAAKADLAAREGDAVRVTIDKAVQDKSFAQVYAKLLQAVKDGNRELIDVYIEQLRQVDEESKNKLGDNVELWVKEIGQLWAGTDELIKQWDTLLGGAFETGVISPLLDFFTNGLPKLISDKIDEIKKNPIKALTAPITVPLEAASEAVKSVLYKKPGAKGEVPKDVFDAAAIAKEQALSNAVSRAQAATSAQAATAGDLAGRLARSVTPERAKELDLPGETISVQAKSIEEQLKNVDKEWTTFYEETLKTNKSAKDIQGILERRIAKDKDTPELFTKELESIKERVSIEAKAQVAGKDAAQASEDHLQASRALADSAQRMVEEQKTADPARAAILETRINDQLAKQALEQEEVTKTIAATKTALTNLNIHVAGTAISAEDMEKEYKVLKQKSSATNSAIDNLTRVREAAFSSGNAQYVKDNELDQTIYNLKVKSLDPIREASKTAIFRMEGIPDALRAVEGSYEGISKFFETGDGAQFLEAHADAAKRVEALNEVNKTLAESGLDLAEKQSTLANVIAEQALKSSTEKVLSTKSVLDREQALANLNNPVKAEVVKDATEIDTAKELVALQEKANDARVKGYDAAIAKAKELKGVEATVVELSTTKQKISGLESLRVTHQQTYEQMRDVELKHAQAVEALESQLFSQKRGQLEFIRGIEAQGFDDRKQLEMAEANASSDASKARRLLAQGEYAQGKQLLESAIKEQEAVVQTLAQTRSRGDAELLIEKGQLKGMYRENNKLLEGEIALHRQAQAEAKQAADQQLAAIQGLTWAIETLNKNLAAISVGAQGAAQEITGVAKAAQDLSANSNIKLNFDVNAAREGLKAILDGVAQVAQEVQTPKEMSISVANARGSIATLREQVIAYAQDANTPVEAQTEIGKALGSLTDLDSAMAKVGQSGDPAEVRLTLGKATEQLTALNESISKLDLPKPKVDIDPTPAANTLSEVENGVNSLEQTKRPDVNVNNAPALQGIKDVQESLDGVQDKEVTVTVNHVDNYVRNGSSSSNVPEAPAPEGQFAGGGLVRTRVSNNEYQMPPETVKAVGTDYLSNLGEISQPGLITGPGSGTSDSIPRNITENSFIIPARVVDKLGIPFLDKIRWGKKPTHHAAGGLISDGDIRGALDRKKREKDAEIVDWLFSNIEYFSLARTNFTEGATTGGALRGMEEALTKAKRRDLIPLVAEGMRTFGASKPMFAGQQRAIGFKMTEREQLGADTFDVVKQNIVNRVKAGPTTPESENISVTGPYVHGALDVSKVLDPVVAKSSLAVPAVAANLPKNLSSSIIQPNQGSAPPTHIVEIRSESLEAPARIHTDEQNFTRLLANLKTLKGVNIS
jgi:hypothetical protein